MLSLSISTERTVDYKLQTGLFIFLAIVALRSTVEWSLGVVATGWAYLFLSLSVDSASLAQPYSISKTPSSVGSRTGAPV
jgi:hypothetical protein